MEEKRHKMKISWGGNYSTKENNSVKKNVTPHPIFQIIDCLDKKIYAFSLSSAKNKKSEICNFFEKNKFETCVVVAEKVLSTNETIKPLYICSDCAVIDFKYTTIENEKSFIFFEEKKYQAKNYNKLLKEILEIIYEFIVDVECYNGNVDCYGITVGDKVLPESNLPYNILEAIEKILFPEEFE